jgi:hypothetical protein
MEPSGWLREPRDLPTGPGAAVGITVGVSFAPKLQLHVGVLHADDGHPPRVLHLAWHHDLCNEPLPQNEAIPFWWASLPVPGPMAEDIAALCRRVAERAEDAGRAGNVGLKIKYGLVYEGGKFTMPDGVAVLAGREIGFTCATFVMAVLEGAGLPLLDWETWPSRPDDALWRAGVLALMTRTGVEPAHIDRVAKEPIWTRYRPHEVAGAARARLPRARLPDVEPLAQHILRVLLPGAPGT